MLISKTSRSQSNDIRVVPAATNSSGVRTPRSKNAEVLSVGVAHSLACFRKEVMKFKKIYLDCVRIRVTDQRLQQFYLGISVFDCCRRYCSNFSNINFLSDIFPTFYIFFIYFSRTLFKVRLVGFLLVALNLLELSITGTS